VTVRGITVLGSTGSVGRSTLDLVARAPERFRVEALTAHGRVETLIEQALRFRPRFVAIGDAKRRDALADALVATGIAVGAGPDAVREAAERPADWVMAAIVGAAGLAPALAAVRRGAIVALANKECLVSAGDLFMAEVRRRGAVLLPVDSEHNAIFQVFDSENRAGIEKLILTASGGPFRTRERATLANVTPAEAVAHPNWSMGAKISTDSATMMNKGLEIIEAHHLFAMPGDRIDVVIHPQSIVHSLVAYVDGSILAQLGSPDMRTPIAYTLAWPNRMTTPSERLDLARIASLTFEAPNHERFPALPLARQALGEGAGAPTVLNAANEIAVAAFLDGRIGFLRIVDVVAETLAALPRRAPADLDDVLALDGEARRAAAAHVQRAVSITSVA
jgi:1-deoxy-D-xylulose-5-phosphate reductoisomerase